MIGPCDSSFAARNVFHGNADPPRRRIPAADGGARERRPSRRPLLAGDSGLGAPTDGQLVEHALLRCGDAGAPLARAGVDMGHARPPGACSARVSRVRRTRSSSPHSTRRAISVTRGSASTGASGASWRRPPPPRPRRRREPPRLERVPRPVGAAGRASTALAPSSSRGRSRATRSFSRRLHPSVAGPRRLLEGGRGIDHVLVRCPSGGRDVLGEGASNDRRGRALRPPSGRLRGGGRGG